MQEHPNGGISLLPLMSQNRIQIPLYILFSSSQALKMAEGHSNCLFYFIESSDSKERGKGKKLLMYFFSGFLFNLNELKILYNDHSKYNPISPGRNNVHYRCTNRSESATE